MSFRSRTQLATVPIGAPTAAVDIGDAFQTGGAGVASDAAHQHAFPAPAAGYVKDLAAAADDGAETTPARAGHRHRHRAADHAAGGFADLSATFAALGGTNRINDGLELDFGTTGSGGQAKGKIHANVPPTFASGAALVAGTTTTHPIVPGDMSAYVGYYFVAIDQGGASVPVISVAFDGTNSTLTISAIGGLAAGQAWEISQWPGGTAGRAGYVYKPTTPRTIHQIGPNLGLYQVDDYGTAYLIGFDGTGANGDHFRDLRVADFGCRALECDGTPGDTSPGGTEPANVGGFLLYNGAGLKAFRDNSNVNRSKSISLDGATGDISNWAAAASGASPLIVSPRLRMVGTYWAGGVGPSTDRVGYLATAPTDVAGDAQIQVGFEHRASPFLSMIDGAVAVIQPYTDQGAGLGSAVNRFSQYVAGTNGFRVWNTSGDANPIAELNVSGLHFGPGGGAVVDTLVARGAAGVVIAPQLVKAGVPVDGDFPAAAPPNGTLAINSSGAAGSRLYVRVAGAWTAIA